MNESHCHESQCPINWRSIQSEDEDRRLSRNTIVRKLEEYDVLVEFHTDIDKFHTDIDKFHTDIDKFHTDIDKFHTDIDKFHTDIDKFHTDIDKFHTDIDKFHTDIDKFHTDIDKFHTDIDKFHTDIDKFHTDVFLFCIFVSSLIARPKIRTDSKDDKIVYPTDRLEYVGGRRIPSVCSHFWTFLS
jgi:cytochrome c556